MGRPRKYEHPIDKPVSIRLPNGMNDEFRAIAAKQGHTQSSFGRQLLMEFLERYRSQASSPQEYSEAA